jgi:flagellar protein FlaF
MTSSALATPPAGRTPDAYRRAGDATLTPRQAEYRVVARATHRLSDAAQAYADRATGAHARLLEALHDNLRLWLAFAADLADERNGLPDDLRAQLLSLAVFVERETARVVREDGGLAEAAAAFVDINTAVMKGLRGQTERDPCPA